MGKLDIVKSRHQASVARPNLTVFRRLLDLEMRNMLINHEGASSIVRLQHTHVKRRTVGRTVELKVCRYPRLSADTRQCYLICAPCPLQQRSRSTLCDGDVAILASRCDISSPEDCGLFYCWILPDMSLVHLNDSTTEIWRWSD